MASTGEESAASSVPAVEVLRPAERRRRIAVGLLRALVAATVLIAVYYLAPLKQIAGVPLAVSLIVALLVLVAVSVWEIRAIIRARHPRIRGIEALATTVPLFLLLYAASYYVMAQADPANFTAHPLTRTDCLYFTITVFATVGFGDVSAASQGARLLVTTQMILDLLILGLGIKVFTSAVQRGRQRPTPDPGTGTADDS